MDDVILAEREPRLAPARPIVGRDDEIAQLSAALDDVPIAILLGLPGAGKTAIARLVAAGARRAVIHASAAEVGDALELADRVERAGALLVLEDAHAAPAVAAIVGARLRRGRMLVTSRERRRALGEGPERCEVWLRGLDERAAERLWARLDELAGEAGGFREAWRRTGGNPRQLERAHRGELDAEDPAGAIGRALAGATWEGLRRAAALLALAPGGLPPRAIDELDVRPALAELCGRLVADANGAGHVIADPAFACAIARRLGAEQEASLRRELHDVLILTEAWSPRVVRSTAAQLAALGRTAELDAFLVRVASSLLRAGAPRSLLDEIDAIPVEERSNALRLVAIDARARRLELVIADDDARSSVGDAGALGAELALSRGRVSDALALAQAAGDAHARIIAALAARCAGDRAGARTLLDAHDPALAIGRALLTWLDGDPGAPGPDVIEELARVPGSTPALAGLPILLAALVGDPPRADFGEDVRAVAYHGAGVAWRKVQAGARREGLALLETHAALLRRGGDVLGSLIVDAWIVRARGLLGRGDTRRGAGALAAEGARRGIALALELAELAYATDVRRHLAAAIAGLVDDGQRAVWIAPEQRDAIRALEAAFDGRRLEALALVDRLARLPAADFPLERTMGHLARACLERLARQAERAATALDDARREAVDGAVDATLLAELAEPLQGCRAISAHGARIARAADLDGGGANAVVIDGRSHEVRAPGGIILSLERRPVVRRLLYALAAHAGSAVPREELTMAIWSRPYSGRVHDNPLKVNVAHLKATLASTGLGIHAENRGYRLDVPPQFLFLDADP
jgi:hypothetical protein